LRCRSTADHHLMTGSAFGFGPALGTAGAIGSAELSSAQN
jgi:hypothetical protein